MAQLFVVMAVALVRDDIECDQFEGVFTTFEGAEGHAKRFLETHQTGWKGCRILEVVADTAKPAVRITEIP